VAAKHSAFAGASLPARQSMQRCSAFGYSAWTTGSRPVVTKMLSELSAAKPTRIFRLSERAGTALRAVISRKGHCAM
jgi:hypothetical protein